MTQPRSQHHGDLAGYLAWAEKNWKAGQWCAKHWAPAPVEGENGIMASLLLMQEIVDLMSAAGIHGDAKKQNQYVAEHSPLCCFLGDEKVKEIWEQVRVETMMRKGARGPSA